MYWDYFKYVCDHKKNVFKCCYKESKKWFKNNKYKEGIFYLWHGITHDMSKFSPKEFKPYAKWFNGKYGIELREYIKKWEGRVEKPDGYWDRLKDINTKCKLDFDIAWEHHFRNNKHHWNYWCYDWFKYETEPECPQLKYCKLKEPIPMPYEYIKQMILDWTAMSLKFGDTPEEYYLNNYNEIKLSDETRMWVEYELGLNDSVVCNYGHTLKQFAELYDEDTFNKCFKYIKDKYNRDVYSELNKN